MKISYAFHTKEAAQSFAKAAQKDKSIRLDGKVSVRRPPQKKNSRMKGYTASFEGVGLGDTNDAAKLARSMDGLKMPVEDRPASEFKKWWKKNPEALDLGECSIIEEMEALLGVTEARMSPSKWKISDDREGNVYLSLDGKKHLMTPGTAYAVATELKQYAKKHGVD